jgi:hypothetical protein
MTRKTEILTSIGMLDWAHVGQPHDPWYNPLWQGDNPLPFAPSMGVTMALHTRFLTVPPALALP